MARLGPSFACPAPHDSLGQLICGSATLSRLDLEFVQAYQALRQQSGPAGQATLRAEAATFGRTVRGTCAIPVQAGDASPADAAPCVEREYARQRAVWVARLEGPARQEARRGLDEQIVLQRDLQEIGLLDADQAIDGVYGTSTRVAVSAFQQTVGLPVTGLLGDADALALSRQRLSHATRPQGTAAQEAAHDQGQAEPSRTAGARSGWEDLLTKAASVGITVTVAPEPCVVTFQLRDPDALAAAAQAGPPAVIVEHPSDAGGRLFAAEMAFLRTSFAAQAVHAFYAARPAATDRCRFEAAAFTTDLYGRDVAQPLFAFAFDRETYAKVVWNRFDPANMPRIVSSFEYDAYAVQRLRKAADDGAVTSSAQAGPQHPSTSGQAAAPVPAELTRAAAPRAPAAPGDVSVAHWAGSSTMTTRPFHMDGPWEVRWRNDGVFSATLHQVASESETIVAMAREHGESSAYQASAGDFYLEINATSPWTVDLVRVSAP